VEQIEAHHKARHDGIIEAMGDGSMDAYQLAHMVEPGKQASGCWEDLPNVLKFIATRDCLAHLLYLESGGRVRKENSAGRLVYSLAQEW
jgi:hypothetical protein